MLDDKYIEIEKVKKSALDLFNNSFKINTNNDEPTNNKINELFTKETFVISNDDLNMLNGEVEKQLIVDKFKELDKNNKYPIDNLDNNSENDFSEDFNDNYDDYKDDEYYTKLENVRYYVDDDTEFNSQIDEINNKSSSDETQLDSELDNTNFLYDPPVQYKEKFLLYLLKSSPLLVIFIILIIVSSLASSDFLLNLKNFLPNSFLISNNENTNPFLNHKLYLLEEDVKSLKNLQNLGTKFKSIESDFSNVKDHISKLERFLSNTNQNTNQENNIANNYNLNSIFEKLNKLESKVESLSNDLNDEISNKIQLKELKDQLNRLSNIETNKKLNTKQNKLTTKYYNIAHKCHVIRQLTSYPSLQQYKKNKRRKSLQSRIVYGFPDFVKRLLNSSKTPNKSSTINSLGNIKLLSSSNSPKNVLSEQPNLFWQNLASDMPIYLTVGLNEPIKIYELGIYHSRHQPHFNQLNESINKEIKNRWFKAAPKNVEFLVRPVSNELVKMKESLSKYFNQDLNFGSSIKKNNNENLNNWVRVGNLDYDINSNRAYQPINWNNEIKAEIAKWNIIDFMIIIHTNWGDEIVVLDTIRIFQFENEKKDDPYDNMELITHDDDNNINNDDEVKFLGEDEF